MAVINDTYNVTVGTVLQQAGVQMLVLNVMNFISTVIYIMSILQFVVGIFIAHSIYKNLYNLRTAFFIIYSFGSVVDLVGMVAQYVRTEYGQGVAWYMFPDPEFMYYEMAVCNVIVWYHGNFEFQCHTLMTVNRYTAIKFWQTQKKIWKPRNLRIVLIALFLSPFVVGYDIFIEPICVIDIYDEVCQDFDVVDTIISLIWPMINFVVSFVFSMLTVLANRNLRNMHKQDKIKGFERRLIKQSVVTSTIGIIAMVFSVGNELTHSKRRDSIVHALLYLSCGQMANICFAAHRYSVVVTLLVVSPTFRRGFLKFIKLEYVFTNVLKIQSTGGWVEENESSG